MAKRTSRVYLQEMLASDETGNTALFQKRPPSDLNTADKQAFAFYCVAGFYFYIWYES